jgi:hypothetical protein
MFCGTTAKSQELIKSVRMYCGDVIFIFTMRDGEEMLESFPSMYHSDEKPYLEYFAIHNIPNVSRGNGRMKQRNHWIRQTMKYHSSTPIKQASDMVNAN